MTENKQKNVATKGSLKERPVPRLLQQLYRKQITGYCILIDETQDESEVYLREGMPVYVGRPVETDRLDNLLVELGIVSPEIIAQAKTQVGEGNRMGEVLESMGYLDKHSLTYVLKAQILRKLTRLFFIANGTYSVFLEDHPYGVGDDLLQMQVDPRSVFYPGIRAAYDLPRVTHELSRLKGQEFRLQDVPSSFFAAMGIPPEDTTVEVLQKSYLTLESLDARLHRPLEARSVVLSLYYADLLDRRPIHFIHTKSGSHQSAVPDTNVPHTLVDSGSLPESKPVSVPLAPVIPPKMTPATPSAKAPVAPPPLPQNQMGTHPPKGLKRTIELGFQPDASLPQFIPDTMPSPPSSPRVTAVPKSPTVRTPSDDSQRASLLDLVQRLDSLSHFELLSVSESASAGEVGIAFVRAARQFHPDRLAGIGSQDLVSQAERVLSRMSEAAMVLSDPIRRAEYIASKKLGSNEPQTNVPSLLEAENYFLKGEVFLKKGDHGKAIECFTLAQKGNPAEPQYKAHLLWAQFEDPHARKANIVRDTLHALEAVLVERPKFARGFYWVGLLWKFLNESEKASHAFREAVALDESFIEAGRELRLLEMRKGKKTQPNVGPHQDPTRSGFLSRFFKK